VTDSTSRILLESAYFDPTSVRRTSKRIGVSSAASYRFERGVDPNGVLFAADRAAALITEVAGGTVSSTLFDRYPVPIRPRAIVFRPGRCRDLLGIDVSDIAAREYLERLGMSVTALGPCGWQVSAPTNRPDLAIEEDLIEEVGRLYGYDRLPETLPGGAASGALNGRELFVRRVRDALTAEGLFEAVGNTLTSPNLLSTSGLSLSPIWPAEESASQVPLRNPLSEEFSVLRPSLLPGLLAAAQHNLRRGTQDVFLFEAGYGNARIGSGEPEYHLLVSGLLLGSRWSGSWNAASATTEFFAAKGTVEGLLRGLGLPSAAAARADHPALHPGRSAWLRVGAERVGIIGELHPDRAAALDLPRGVYLFELDGEALQRAFLAQRRIYEPPSRHPRALRDLAVVVDDTVPSAAVEKILSETLGTWCRNVRLFDVYTGPPLAAGRSSLAYALELGADERTLTDAEVDERLNIARERLRTELAAEFRG
jgi:phenylalanyl-tRNA synthetase beta chain